MTTLLPPCVVCSRDTALARRLQAFLAPMATVHTCDTPAKLNAPSAQGGEPVILYDIRGPGALEKLGAIVRARPDAAIIVFGIAGSEPMFEARAHGVYAVEDVELERQRVQDLVSRAFEHARLLEENQRLRHAAAGVSALQSAVTAATARSDPSPLQPARHFPGALRHFNDVEALLENLAEGVAGSVMVARVGIFCRRRDAAGFHLRAGLRCLEDTARILYGDEDPLANWLTLNAHIVCRSNLEHIREPAARSLLNRALDQYGAEVLIPLQVRERLLGWMFVGHRTTGIPFGPVELENLALVAEHVSTTLENALLYEEVALQKSLAETLLHSIPTGIIAVDERGVIRWFNSVAQTIFNLPAETVLGKDAEVIGSHVSGLLRGALAVEEVVQPEEWSDPRTRRTLSLQTRRLHDGQHCFGAVALVQDLTVERMLEAKEEQLERAAFWTELAAAMSHEIRNPLVAIKTFAQLLPERYQDDDFRSEFSSTVNAEVDRLNGIIDQISRFAHPRALELKQLSISHAIKRGLDMALQTSASEGIWVDTSIDEDLPSIDGDETALAECVAHLIANAMEALAGRDNPKIVLAAREFRDGDMPQGIAVSVKDNGPGIRQDIRSKVFSPFCTTKARGMGLGLPIVKRTVVDHGGRIQIECTGQGTCVTVLLPSKPQKEKHETHTDRGRRSRKS